MKKILIKYSEIAIKGKNRTDFENKLIGNIIKSTNRNNLNLISLKKERGRILCIFENEKEDIIKALKNILGIRYFSFIEEIEKTPENLFILLNMILENFKERNINLIGFKTKRSDKNFPLNSPEVNAQFAQIAKSKGFIVDFKNAVETIFTEITTNKIYMYSQKIYCYGGLPIGSSGRALVLLSGGIDSPVAAWQILKRGCHVDFLHFHTYAKNDFVMNTKIKTIIEKLNDFQYKSTLYLVPYSFYEFMSKNIPPRYELIFFKYYIFKMASVIGKKNGYDAIVSGDSLAQVASQTIENLKAVNYNMESLVLRPLIANDKEEIINMAKTIDTFDLSIEEYKDCCSLASKNPVTKANYEKFKEIVDKSNIDELIEKSIENMNYYLIKS